MEARYERQSDIVPTEAVQAHAPVIVGVGAIGSQVARQLVHMGSSVRIVDFDTVDDVNMCCQGFKEADIGRPKVEALADELRSINSEVTVEVAHRRFNKIDRKAEVVFCCVDSIQLRGRIFNSMPGVKFFVDGRMKGGDTIRIVQARVDTKSMINYPNTIFAEEEASEGSCTSKTTIFGAYIAAGMMVSEYARWLKGVRVFTEDYLVSLPATEMGPTNAE